MIKNTLANTGDMRDVDSISGLGRYPGVGNGNLLQYSWLENSMDTGAWWATIHGNAMSQTQLSNQTCTQSELIISPKLKSVGEVDSPVKSSYNSYSLRTSSDCHGKMGRSS